jgi:hypothetical protein
MFEEVLNHPPRKLRNTLKAGQSYTRKLIKILKFILLPATFGFIGYKLIYAYKINDLFGQAEVEWSVKNISLLTATTAFMVVQWMLEARKWQLLVSRNEATSYNSAFKGVLSGAALNIVTPNQLGDFVGRILYLKQTDNVRGTLVTVIGHTAQVTMTAAFGICASLWLILQQDWITESMYLVLNAALLLLFGAAVFGFLNIGLIAKLKLPARIAGYLHVFELYNRNELIRVLIMSLARYVIFMIQYYLLTQLFMVNVTPLQCIMCVMAMMCAQSFVPSFILVELGMRGASALWFFGLFTEAVTPVLLTTYVLWIINAMIPGIAGLFFLLKWRRAQ